MNAEMLRASIIQKAIEGKLVPQLDEEPAVEQKGEPPEEEPFGIPSKWKWVRLSTIASSNVGLTYKPADLVEDLSGIPVLRSNNIQNGKLNLNELKRVKGTNLLPKNFVLPGDLLMCARNGSKRLVGKSCLVPELKERMMFGAFMAVIRSNFTPYLHIFFSSDAFKKYLGSVNTTTINQITQKNLLNTWIPLPPLDEQNRIVKKIEELLPLVDEYGRDQEQLEKINKDFPVQMEKSLLHEAISGKIVPQRDDEPEVEQLGESPEEVPFEIPKKWKWVRMSDILTKLTDGEHKTPKYREEGVPFLSAKNISSGKIDFSQTKFISKEDFEIFKKRCNPQKGDILLSKVGTTGVPAIVEEDRDFGLFVSVALLKPDSSLIRSDFLYYQILSPHVQQQAKNNTRGVGNKNWVLKDIAKTLVVLPPLEEQKRIVEKLDKLMLKIQKLK